MNTECMYRINRSKKGESIISCALTLVNGIRNIGEELFPESVAVVKRDGYVLSEVYENKFYHPVRRIKLKAGDVVVFVEGKLHLMYDAGYTSVKLMFPDFDVPFEDMFEDVYTFKDGKNFYDEYAEMCVAFRRHKII